MYIIFINVIINLNVLICLLHEIYYYNMIIKIICRNDITSSILYHQYCKGNF